MTFDVENLKVTEQHKALSQYIKAETGKAPSASTVALVLTLQSEYRKSDAYKEEQARAAAEREARRAAREEKKRADLNKALEKARRLAAELGLDIPDAGAALSEPDEEPEPEPEPAPAPKKAPAKRKTATGRTVTAVPDPEPDEDEDEVPVTLPDPDNDTSAIVVEEAEDGFVVEEGEGDDDFFDPEDEEEY